MPERPTARVNDYAGALSQGDRARLEAQLAAAESGTRQLVVAIFPSLEGESPEDFSIRLAEKWKIGGKKNDDGVLVTLFIAERKVRIEVGYGLEDRLTDALSSRVIRELMAPRFKQGDYAGGLQVGLEEIDRIVARGETRLPPEGGRRGPSDGEGLVGGLVLFVLFVVVLFVLSRRRGGGGGGGGFTGGGGGWVIFPGGGGRGGWSSGGRSSGGFSGGGGSFGGGGASGDW